MSKAQVGHSALDPERIDIHESGSFEDRMTFLEAAVYHADGQLTLLEDQLDRITDKAAQVQHAWDGKVHNAQAMVDAAREDLAHWQRQLDEAGH
jgi:hypothetical protein